MSASISFVICVWYEEKSDLLYFVNDYLKLKNVLNFILKLKKQRIIEYRSFEIIFYQWSNESYNFVYKSKDKEIKINFETYKYHYFIFWRLLTDSSRDSSWLIK